ncbi:4518_t:CDS:1, partial [Funneliformis geosporum]
GKKSSQRLGSSIGNSSSQRPGSSYGMFEREVSTSSSAIY